MNVRRFAAFVAEEEQSVGTYPHYCRHRTESYWVHNLAKRSEIQIVSAEQINRDEFQAEVYNLRLPATGPSTFFSALAAVA